MKHIKLLAAAAVSVLLSSSVGYADMHTDNGHMQPVHTTTQTDTHNKLVVADPTIASEVEKNIASVAQLKNQIITVSVKDGVVTLHGEVKTDEQYEKAIMAADIVTGVKDVNADKFVVKDSKEPLTDLYTTAKVKAVLVKNKILDMDNPGLWKLNIETKDGVVYLTGKVDNDAQKADVIKVINSLDGVTVNSDGLHVVPEADANSGVDATHDDDDTANY